MIWKTPVDVALFAEAAELVCLLLSAGGGGRCAVRQHGGLEEGQKYSELDQPDRCAETWPSTSPVHGKIAALLTRQTMVGSLGLQEGLKRRKEQKHPLADERRKEANMLKVHMRLCPP